MIQVKLLRVIQEKIIERVGDNKPIKVDMRIITATNKNLRELVNKGLFREDLYYRLSVFPIHTPTLRERMKDIPLLCEYFISKFNKQTGKLIKGLTEDAFRIVMDYDWPGNVRELENSIEHAFVVCSKKLIDVFDLPQDIRQAHFNKEPAKPITSASIPVHYLSAQDSLNTQLSFRIITKEKLENILSANKFNRKQTAMNLGISTVALWKKMKKFGIIE
jgi:transcriptional regulator with PAS, ATPase and Fis domain